MQQNRVGEPKLFRLLGHFSLALLLSVVALGAETFEDFKRSQAESFTKYKDERDNAFNAYLTQQWEAYNAFKGTPIYEKPKPKVIEPAQPKQIKSVGPTVSIKIKPIEKFIVAKPTEVVPVLEKEPLKAPEVVAVKEIPKVLIIASVKEPLPAKETQKEGKKDITLNFYGASLGFDVPQGLKNAKFYPRDQKGISNFFDAAASSDHENLIAEIASVSKTLNLNDWGVYLLVFDISHKIFSNEDDVKLLSWFIFNKLGYAVKVGLAQKHVVLMHYSKNIIYATPNYSFDNNKFYVVSNYAKENVGELYSYKQNYPGAQKALDLSMRVLPNLPSQMKTKTLTFEDLGKNYSVAFQYNQNLMDFMATYPQADYETFFNTPLDGRTYKDIASSLKKYVDGKKISDAMNFVLHFVQKSFAYERDDQQFGREKVMFAQETLYFNKSDCEDRAVLFSYLVKELFNVNVVGVKYKDHMATALYIPMDGDKVINNKKELVVADPTYINASIGQSMPKYKPQRPESFIVVKKD